MQTKDRPFALCDIVRETARAVHQFLGPGHLERVYENALVHRLRKRGLQLVQQQQLLVYDEDGTELGAFTADLVIEEMLLLELKATRAVVPEHIAQLLGYLRAANLEHGALLNFGTLPFYIKMYGMSRSLRQGR
ncbi:MAG: GxxExxY protein [Verrucomicrobia bacterium]|nr:GxxExxY protein [Verrucomicrobiota bacterium]